MQFLQTFYPLKALHRRFIPVKAFLKNGVFKRKSCIIRSILTLHIRNMQWLNWVSGSRANHNMVRTGAHYKWQCLLRYSDRIKRSFTIQTVMICLLVSHIGQNLRCFNLILWLDFKMFWFRAKTTVIVIALYLGDGNNRFNWL